MKEKDYLKIAYLSSFLRLISPFLIFFNPVIASIANLPLDGMDGLWFSKAKISKKEYASADKFFDFYWYTFILFWVISRPLPTLIFWLLIGFYFLRLIGGVIFFVTKNQRIFLIFPNLFEVLFWFYILCQALNLETFTKPPLFWIWLVIITALKEVQEYLAHGKDFSSLNFLLKKKLINWTK